MTRSAWQAKVGVGERQVKITGRRSVTVPVVVEEGPNRGQPGGHHTDHRDGRRDATVTPAALTLKPRITGV